MSSMHATVKSSVTCLRATSREVAAIPWPSWTQWVRAACPRAVAVLGLALLAVCPALVIDSEDGDDDDGGCVLGLPMCRGIGSGAGDPVWATAGPDN